MRPEYFPDAVYAALPYVYLAAGAATITWLPGGLGLSSGLLLCSAGLAVATMRFRYRRALAREVASIHLGASADESGPPTEGHPTALVRLVWRSQYECGLPVIDEQHRGLVEQGSELLNAVLRRDPLPAVEARLTALVDDIHAHFRIETEVLARSSHPITPEHEADHLALLERGEVLRRRFARGQVDVAELVSFVADDLFAQHITKEDLQLTSADLARERAPARAPRVDAVAD